MADNGNGKHNPESPVITLLPPDPRIGLAEAGVNPWKPIEVFYDNKHRPLWRLIGHNCWQKTVLGHH